MGKNNIFLHYVLPALGIIGLILGIYLVIFTHKSPSIPPIPYPPPKSPYTHSIAGQGLTEASSENILIGTPITELVKKIYVTAGQRVKAGDLLFAMDDRELQAQLLQAQTAWEVALANYERQLALPRPEDVPPVVAQLKQAEVNYINFQKQFMLYESVPDKRAISVNAYNQARYNALLAKFQMEQSQKNLDLLEAGAWVRDLEIYRAQLKNAQSNINFVMANLDRSIIRAPVEGEVLRVNVHAGEVAQAVQNMENYIAQTGTFSTPLIIFGAVEPMHIRVQIDEEDSWRVIPDAPGTAFVRGNSRISVPLKFVRLEPLLMPKTSLTGQDNERVDTRVIQIIYSFERKDLPIYMGQLMDIYLEGRPNL